jgi:hypothetical protein
MDVAGSSEALAVQQIASSRHKIISLSAAAAVRLTNEACTPVSVLYVHNTHAIAHTVGSALVARGDKTWFFITVDYSFGYDLENDTADVVKERRGEVPGRACHPLDARDWVFRRGRGNRRPRSSGWPMAARHGGYDQQAAGLGMIPGPQVFCRARLAD